MADLASGTTAKTPPGGSGKKRQKKGGKGAKSGSASSSPRQEQNLNSSPSQPVDVSQPVNKGGQTMTGVKVQGQQQRPEVKGQGPAAAAGNMVEDAPQKTKAQLKAERRAIQEAQRAKKQSLKADAGGKAAGGKSGGAPSAGKSQVVTAKKLDTGSGKPQSQSRVPDNRKLDDEMACKRLMKKLEREHVPHRADSHRKVSLFSHLKQYERDTELTKNIPFTASSNIHPAIIKLGLQYADGTICGSNARCVALLAALKQVIADYSTPAQKELSRDLDATIKPYISFLIQCRPLSVSMGNAIKYLKWHMNHLPTGLNDSQAKEKLQEEIDKFIEENITLAAEAISESADSKITDGDTILVYACSSLIRKVLCDAHKKGRNFSVIVVDSRPKLEGRVLLRRLVQQGIKCSYVLINSASYAMKQVSKVFLGAHALLANGCVMSRVGSSQLSLLAKSCNVPVLVCCETYKFCERVQTDSFVFNELGDPNSLVVNNSKNACALEGWKDNTSLSLLNLVYDVTPPELITMVITEIGMVPCTSVPVVLRFKQAETSQ